MMGAIKGKRTCMFIWLGIFFAITVAPCVSSFSLKNAKKVSSMEEAEQTCLRDNAVIEQ